MCQKNFFQYPCIGVPVTIDKNIITAEPPHMSTSLSNVCGGPSTSINPNISHGDIRTESIIMFINTRNKVTPKNGPQFSKMRHHHKGESTQLHLYWLYSACATRQSHVANSRNVKSRWDRSQTNDRIQTECRHFFIQIYFGMLAGSKMYYTVIIRMRCISVCTYF